MTEWTKPSGRTITVNDNPDNDAQAKKLGWKKAGETEAPVKKTRKKRTPKAQ